MALMKVSFPPSILELLFVLSATSPFTPNPATFIKYRLVFSMVHFPISMILFRPNAATYRALKGSLGVGMLLRKSLPVPADINASDVLGLQG